MLELPMRKKEKTKDIQSHLERLVSRYPQLLPIKEQIWRAYEIMAACFEKGGKLLVCGNGGSAADADHIVGELMKGFYKTRPLSEEQRGALGPLADRLQGALPAIALTQHAALSTAFLNDVDPYMIFAQQVYGYGKQGDCFLGISTSGNAQNVGAAAHIAKAMGLCTIGLTAQHGGRLREIADVCLCAPVSGTADAQELHLPIYHTLCAMLEESFFDE